MNNKIVSGLLTASIIASVATPIFATTKEENIYANLDNNGNVKDIYVVNTFLLDEDGKIVDYGDYTNLRNLSGGSEEIKIDNNIVTVNGKTGKNYYQGKLQTNNIPWTINVKYYLNGEEISSSDLAGKSGALEIRISVKQNKNVNDTFFENYLLQTSLSLDTEKCKNIQADGATIANVGSKKQLTYNILSGSEKEISIKSDVTNFELKDGISFNGVLMSMAIDNFDTSIINDQVSLLKTGVEKLNTGANKLKTGSEKYKSGISEFAKKTKDLPSGSSQVQSGINQALEGVKTIESKIASLGVGSSSSSNSQIQASIKSSAEQEAKKQVQNSVTQELTKLAQSAWYQELDQNTQLQIANSIKETATSVATPMANNVALTTANTVSNAYETASESAMKQLTTGLKELETGLETLSTEYSKMDKGLKQISSSASTLSSSYNEIDAGISELSNGINTLYDKTKNLDGEVDEKIDEILAKFENSDYKPVSFTSSKNQEVEAVQFVIKTEGISIKEETKEVSEQEENLSFWQKVGNLFKK